MKRLRLHFSGNKISRETFLDRYVNFFMFHLEFEGANIQFYMLLKEIIKNIYDHAGGKGELIFLMEGKKVHFMLKDFGKKSFDLNQIKKNGSTKLGNGVNFGQGIGKGLIEDLARGIEIDLRVDTQKGFCYSGTYRLR